MKKFPDFIIGGSSKCGTSSLRRVLMHHPEIWIGWKELHYFSHKYFRGMTREEYTRRLLMGMDREYRFIGEKSPSYFNEPDGVKYMHSVAPDLKLIMMMRDPIKRNYSAYNMCQRRFPDGKEWPCDQSFIETIKANLNLPFSFQSNPLRKSHYLYLIQNAYAYYDPEQILIIVLEELIKKPYNQLTKVYDFLDVQPIAVEFINVNRGKYVVPPIEPEAIKILANFYKESNEAIFSILGREIPEWL